MTSGAAPGDDGPPLDVNRILEALDRHGVEYLLVGGASARLYGAERETNDLDCLPRTTRDNLERLAAAMIELHARLRVEGLSDEESAGLAVPIDDAMLANMDISTWRTDAGSLDVLTGIPARDGRRRSYDELVDRATVATTGTLTVRLVALEDLIASKEWADRPKDHEALAELRAINGRRRARTVSQGPVVAPGHQGMPRRPTQDRAPPEHGR